MEFVHMEAADKILEALQTKGGNVCISCNLKAAHALLMTIV